MSARIAAVGQRLLPGGKRDRGRACIILGLTIFLGGLAISTFNPYAGIPMIAFGARFAYRGQARYLRFHNP